MPVIAALLLPLLQAAPGASPPPTTQACKAGFQGPLEFEALPDGRRLKLTKTYAFVGEDCAAWAVPAGAIVDGASIPRYLWTIVGGPLEGKYRNASVIHDWYCDRRTQSWRAVHRMFFQAMMAAGVPETRAKTMYMAVYLQGPRWDDTTIWNNTIANDLKTLPMWLVQAMDAYRTRNPQSNLKPMGNMQMRVQADGRNAEILPTLEDKIQRENLSLNAIDQLVDDIRDPNDFRIQSFRDKRSATSQLD